MVNLKKRSYKKELLDADDIPFEDIKQNMLELNSINSLLGGHKISIAGLNELLANHDKNKEVIICEIGCGGGDNLSAIDGYCKKNNIPVKFIGIDIKKECTVFAKEKYPFLNCSWITGDYASVDLTAGKPDIIFSSLFCHHFTEPELISMLQWMQKNSRIGFFINDLQRHPIAYYSIRFLSSIFSKSYLVKNDAPLSVARGFRKKEWQMLFSKAAIRHYKIEWKWAFRYLIVCKNGE